MEIPKIKEIFGNSFQPNLRNKRAHFGIYPFSWQQGWESSALKLLGKNEPKLQVAPVLERLIFPRAKETLLEWLDQLNNFKGMKWLVSAHFSPLVPINRNRISRLKNEISNKSWASSEGNFRFLGGVDKRLLKLGVVPKDPLKTFKGLDLLD